MVGEAHPGLRDLQDRDPLGGIVYFFRGQQALQRLQSVFFATVQGFAPRVGSTVKI
jgi:hypothetical protein